MRQFQTDEQTLRDLEIFQSSTSEKSIFSYFDSTTTLGGQSFLADVFKSPLNDGEEIQERNLIIAHLVHHNPTLNIQKEALDFIEFYLRQNDLPGIRSRLVSLGSSWIDYFTPSQDSYLKKRGVHEILELLLHLKILSEKLNTSNAPGLFNEFCELVSEIIHDPAINKYSNKKPLLLGPFAVDTCDYIFRKNELNKIRRIIEVIYQIDALGAVARTAREKGLTFPRIYKAGKPFLNLTGIFHLFVENPVKNDVSFGDGQNVMFITGANMAGKSTLIKSIATCVYLAQIGLPVPASAMEMTLFNGLLTTINLSDNLENGRSHFYNEVLRVKFVAENLRNSTNNLIIFDELFRGTNVKDAQESSLSVIDSFSQISDSLFIISTHIVEVAKTLSANKHIRFGKMTANSDQDHYSLDYKLTDGISSDYLGYLILKNENILQILEEKINSLKASSPS